MAAPTQVYPGSAVSGLGPFAANTRYMMTMITGDANRHVGLSEWPITTVLSNDINGMIQAPFLGTQMVADSGWTANSSGGDKTTAVTDYTNALNGTMVTALNLVSAGTGTALSNALDALVLCRKKLQAIETVLVAGKLPNA